jgi:hypothetical protein
MAMKFRKRPIVIEAMQLTDYDSHDAIGRWVRSCSPNAFQSSGAYGGRFWMKLQTLEGTMMAENGDWIIKGIKGEFYPCKPDIFEATYEPVEDEEWQSQQSDA